MNVEPSKAPIAVIGAGPSGAFAALSLLSTGRPVFIFETKRRMVQVRADIVPASILKSLCELGIAEAFKSTFTTRIRGHASAWGASEAIEIDATLAASGGSFVVDREDFDTFLLDQAVRRGAILITAESRVSARPVGAFVLIDWSVGNRIHSLRCGLAVQATGRGGGLLGDAARIRIDDLVGQCATLQPSQYSESPKPYFLIEACEDGWWYSAPLESNKTLVVFITESFEIPKIKGKRPENFRERIVRTNHTKDRIGCVSHDISVGVAPAFTSIRKQLYGRNWISLGDAAATFDPVAGQGIEISAASATALARILNTTDDQSVALREVARAQVRLFQEFLDRKREMYSIETRWPSAPFWKARQANYRPDSFVQHFACGSR